MSQKQDMGHQVWMVQPPFSVAESRAGTIKKAENQQISTDFLVRMSKKRDR
jgi:hypothetical protein